MSWRWFLWIFWVISCDFSARKLPPTNARDVEKNSSNDRNLNCIIRLTKRILTFIVNRYPFLHKMESLWIDLKYKTIFYKINKSQEPILRKKDGDVKTHILEEKTFERLITILKKKDKRNADIGDKIDIIERALRKLTMQMEVLLTKSNETFY